MSTRGPVPVVGVSLVVAPTRSLDWWPWTLTPLTALATLDGR
jgi:hypothetical protein